MLNSDPPRHTRLRRSLRSAFSPRRVEEMRPRVTEISFEAATRSVKQTTPNNAELRGRGRALTEPGSPHRLFGFECSFDTRDGRLLGSRLSS